MSGRTFVLSLAVVSLVLMAIMALVAVPVFAHVTGEATRIPGLEDTDRGLPAKEPGSGAGAVN